VAVRGIRGATTVEVDLAEDIVAATKELLEALIEANDIRPEDVAGVWFTATDDVRAEFPALAARQLGWVDVPLLCGREMEVSGANPRSIPHCIRVLLLVNSEKAAGEMRFVYQRRAAEIQRDLEELRTTFAGGAT
jgi:chorismate mutase